MIIRLIAETLTPIVSRSRILTVRGTRAIISNRPYFDLSAPLWHRCRTLLLVKQGRNGFPFHFRAQHGYLHLDVKAHSPKQARRKVQTFLNFETLGEFTTWGYGKLRWLFQKSYGTFNPLPPWRPCFRILKGLPPHLTGRERQLVMAGLLHDLVDTDIHASKLGHPITIPDPYVQWLCEHHHSATERANNPDLQLLTEADSRTAGYARLLQIPTFRRKAQPVDTSDLTRTLEYAAQQSIYKLYSTMYHSEPLDRLFASKRQPTETLRRHLVRVANWVLFLLRTPVSSQPASAALAGQPGGTPGPVEMEDPPTTDELFDL